MTPEEKRLLEETHALARDNHHLLRSVRRHQIITDFGKFALWLIFIAIAGYYYLFSLKPAFDTFQETGSIELPASLFGIPSAELQKLIDSYKAGQKP
jgi:hypothetical protein